MHACKASILNYCNYFQRLCWPLSHVPSILRNVSLVWDSVVLVYMAITVLNFFSYS